MAVARPNRERQGDGARRSSRFGKSQITASHAATVTTGGKWPDGSHCAVGSVLMVSGEDDAADTIRPRLEAAGADLGRVHILDGIEEAGDGGEIMRRAFNLKCDLGHLEELLLQLGDVRMVSIDPISAYLGDTDSYKNADVRALLTPLAELAGRFGAAIIGVSHLSKAGGQKALLRVSGSLAFVAAARAAYLIADDEENEGRRLMLPLKNNIGPDQTGFSFRIEPMRLGNGIDTSRIAWDSAPVTRTADDVLAAESSPGDDRSALEDAKDFLCEMLAAGPVEGKTIYRQAEEAGHAKRTIDRAKRELNVDSRKASASMNGPWRWELPPKVAKVAEDCHTKLLATFDDVGNLRVPDEEAF
jgi:putative DNA primase/helicase